MTFGEQLKKIRNEKQLSQPQLSERAGIEQSYLSKLENDKSMPSNEIFRNLLTALEMSLDEFLQAFNVNHDRVHLSQIPDIQAWYAERDNKRSVDQRRYLYICSGLIVLAVTFFYAGFSKLIFSERVYQYYSPGVVLAGEPKNIFEDWSRMIKETGDVRKAVVAEKRAEMHGRLDEQYYISPQDQGPSFELSVEGGKRFYYQRTVKTERRLINGILQVLGVMLFGAGIMGFVLERRFMKG